MRDETFVGREAELETLQEALAGALNGDAVVCLVAGEPGAGKTALLRKFAAIAQASDPELLVAYGACDSFTGTGDPYLPFREILNLLTGDVSQGVAEGRANQENASRLRAFVRMSGRALVENGPDLIDIFVPGGALMARLGGKAAQKLAWTDRLAKKISGETTSAASLNQDNVFEQYTQVLEAMTSERPLLLLVDDLQWADRASLGLLFHLTRRLINDRVMIIAAYRGEDFGRGGGIDGHLKTILGELKRIYGNITIDLDAASPQGLVDAIIDARKNRLGSEFRDAMAGRTAGNPLFIIALLRHMEAAGFLEEDSEGYLSQILPVDWGELPSRIAGVFEMRMSLLTEAQREILDIASVHGKEFYAETISQVMEKKQRKIIKQMSGPLQKEQRLIKTIGLRRFGTHTLSAYGFRQKLLQHYLYDDLDEVERTSLHGDIGSTLESLADDDTSELALALARHFNEAQQWNKALIYSLDGADHAAATGAPADAIAHYRLALELWQDHDAVAPGFDPGAVTEKLADQLVLAGRQDEARECYAQALTLTSGDSLVICRLLRKRSIPFQRDSLFDDAVAILETAEAKLDEAKDEAAQSWWKEWIAIQLQYCWVHYWRNEADLLEERRNRLLPVVEKWGTAEERASLLTAQIHVGLRKSRYCADEQLVSLARNAREGGDLEGSFILGFVLLWARRFEPAIAAFNETFQLAKRAGDVVIKTRAVTYLTVAQRFLHRDEEVAEQIGLARELAMHIGSVEYSGVVLAQEAWLAWRRGDDSLAGEKTAEALRTWEDKASHYPLQWLGLWIRFALASNAGTQAEVAAAAEAMLGTAQMRQPDPIERQLRLVLDPRDGVPDEELAEVNRVVVELAKKYGLL